MATPFRWTTNRALAAAALALGLLATAGQPLQGHRVTLDTQELATLTAGGGDHVTARELADWIVQGKADYRLVDLRDEAAFAAYRIPGAEHVPLARLVDHGLGRNEKIVLYADDGVRTAQAWMLLRARGYAGAYLLDGGLDAWKDQVLFPAAPGNPTPEQAEAFAKQAELARHFGGQPREVTAGGAGLSLTNLRAPAPPPPAPVAATGTRTGAAPRVQKQGC